ncbi:DUF4349 domain-containing protein [Mycolicibacillus trivialis]
MTATHRRILLCAFSALLVLIAGCAGPGPDASSPAAPAPAGPSEQTEHRDVVTTGTVAITVGDVGAAVERLVDLTTGTDGRVDARTETTSANHSPTAELTVRVPAGRLDSYLDDLRELGEVTAVSVDHEDVTTTRVDQDARIAALRTSVDRLTELMRSATSTADLLAAEDALAQRQADLDSQRAQRDRLVDRVDYATITVTVSAETAPVATGFVAAIGQGWRALLTFARTAVTLVGFLLPWSPLLALGVFALVVRRRRRRVQQPAPAPQLS